MNSFFSLEFVHATPNYKMAMEKIESAIAKYGEIALQFFLKSIEICTGRFLRCIILLARSDIDFGNDAQHFSLIKSGKLFVLSEEKESDWMTLYRDWQNFHHIFCVSFCQVVSIAYLFDNKLCELLLIDSVKTLICFAFF